MGRVGADAQQQASESNFWVRYGRVSGRHGRFPQASAASELSVQEEGSPQSRWHLFIDSLKVGPKEQWLSLQYLPQHHKLSLSLYVSCAFQAADHLLEPRVSVCKLVSLCMGL